MDRQSELIERYLNGDIADDDHAELKACMTRDPLLAAYVDGLQSLHDRDRWSELTPADMERALDRMHGALRIKQERRCRQIVICRQLAYVAVMIILAVAPFVVPWSEDRGESQPYYHIALIGGGEITLSPNHPTHIVGNSTYRAILTMPPTVPSEMSHNGVQVSSTNWVIAPARFAVRLPEQTLSSATICASPGATCHRASKGAIVVAFPRLPVGAR